MAKYLVTLTDSIGNIEVTGFMTMTDKEFEHFEEVCETISWDFSYPLGDEELFFSSGEDLLTRVDSKEISNEEYKALKKVFNDEKFGVFVDIDFLEDTLGDIDEDEEEEDEEDYERGSYNDNDDDED